MASSTDESETAVLLDGPALYVDFQDRIWGCGGASAKIESKDVAHDAWAGFVGLFGFAADHPGGDRRGERGAPGGAAVEEVANDADNSFSGEVTILGVVLLSQEGCELARVEGSDVRLIDAFTGNEGQGTAFGSLEKVGAVCAAGKVV